MTRGPVPSLRALNVLAVFVIVLALGTGGWMVLKVLTLGDDVSTLSSANQDQDSALAAQEAALREQNRRLKQAGLPTVPVPSTPSASAEPIASSVTRDDVEAIVSQVLARSPLMSQSQVVATVANYLAANPPERGKPGKPGKPGADGPTLDDVRAIVADVYAADPPADGKSGKAGEDGKPGRGISSAVIDADGHLILSFTDDTTTDLGLVTGAKGDTGADGQIPDQTWDCPAGQYQSGGDVVGGVVIPHCMDLPALLAP